MIGKDQTVEKLYAHAESAFHTVGAPDSNNILLHYVGALNDGYSNALSSRLEHLVAEKIDDKQAKKRFFTVYVEAVQNILLHSKKDDHDHVYSGILIYLNDQKLCSQFYNIVTKAQSAKLTEKYQEVNNLDRKALKKKYMDIMMHGDISEKGGAGLGVITIVLRSKNPSTVRAIPINEEFDIFESEICVDYSSKKS